jgi:ribosome biogenesis GTPase
MDLQLEQWGWDGSWAAALAALDAPDLEPARVIAQHRGLWLVATAGGESKALPTGRFRHQAEDGGLPAVGDWVGVLPSPHGGELRIDGVRGWPSRSWPPTWTLSSSPRPSIPI